ncbi:MAG: hypothetical protein ACYSWR_06675 [Planctomycetota bacterium]|jgi:hypothetical protein
MRFYTGSTRKLSFVRELEKNHIGRVNHPESRFTPYDDERWFADNGAYSLWLRGKSFDEKRYLTYLEKLELLSPKPQFAVLPDIVTKGVKSLEYSMYWLVSDRLPAWKWFLALQDGMDIGDVEPVIHLIDGLFIGGTLGFKAQVKQWVALGKKHGKPVHYGRAGVHHRIHDAYLAGCDSADSAFPLWEKNRFMRFLTWIKQGKYDPDSYKQLCFDY